MPPDTLDDHRAPPAPPPHLIARMAEHPAIARQFTPSADEERATADGERDDPIGDARHAPLRGLVHRYPDRVLLMPHMACAAYCRFCFRRDRVGRGDGALSPAETAAALDYVRDRPEIWEVILTGGDPLMMAPRRLAELVAAIDAIPHVGVIRIHSRVPVADPTRVDAALVEALAARDSAVTVVLHCNHPAELADETLAACRRIIGAGIPMLAQTVLLRGVNDDVATLTALMRALVRNRIKPYYLHHADLARGTGHFRTTLAEGQALVRALRGTLSGLCQPTYVLDIPGGHGKVPVGPCHLRNDGTIEGLDGTLHPYPSCS
ncbi:MAG: lysine-2,3-aminomutase-like protein [Alphaproteobacteria bacterium]